MQFPGSNPTATLSPNKIAVSDLMHMAIFENAILLTIEGSSWPLARPRLRAHHIDRRNSDDHRILNPYDSICKIQSQVGIRSKMVVSHFDMGPSYVLICNINGTVEIAQLAVDP